MQTDDIVRVTLVTETAGVASSNQHYWRIQNVSVDNPSQMVDELAKLYWDSISPKMSDQTVLSCAIWENQTRPEKVAAYPSLAGGNVQVPGPPSTVLRLNRYAVVPGGGPNVSSALTFSGFQQDLSRRGRVINSANMAPPAVFFSSQQVMPISGNSCFPMLRHQLTPPPGPTYTYYDCYRCVWNYRFLILSRRKTTLCAR